MTPEIIATIISISITVISIVATTLTIIFAIRSGELKQFIIEKMEEAEQSTMSGEEKLEYVIKAVTEKYKLLSLIVDIKKIVEFLIKFSHIVNGRK